MRILVTGGAGFIGANFVHHLLETDPRGGITKLDPLTYASVVMLLLAVAGLACWGPAWRAARLDPAITLRAE